MSDTICRRRPSTGSEGPKPIRADAMQAIKIQLPQYADAEAASRNGGSPEEEIEPSRGDDGRGGGESRGREQARGTEEASRRDAAALSCRD